MTLHALVALAFLLGPTRQLPAKPKDLPFSTSEKLVFQLDWKPPWYLFFLPPMNAGEAELSVSDAGEYKGRSALKIDFSAHSSGTFVRLVGIKVEDSWEVLTNSDTFCTFRVFKKEREGKRKRDIEVIYMPETHQLHIR